MKILIAEDDAISRRLLEVFLKNSGYEVVSARDGQKAWEVMQTPGAPSLLVADWMMPGMSGVDLCREIRQQPALKHTYVILLTSLNGKDRIIEGLAAGANDYVTKPFHQAELKARIEVGLRIIELQEELAQRVHELEEALANVKQLQGLLPICSYCKKVRDDQNYWQQVDGYISAHTQVRFSHGVCPECHDTIVKPDLERYFSQNKKPV
ncbi:MAG: response regulator [Verrucomicrobia bacterium]|nr:response regulator [Verrucomicrobiota bacterium]